MSRAANSFQANTVVCATGDAAHNALGAQSVAFGVATGGRQGGDVGASSGAGWPRHVAQGLGDLRHVDKGGAAGTLGRGL